MRKTNIALCRLHECNVTQTLEEFLATLPAYRLGDVGAPLELPTRDNFDYVLVRVQTLAALLMRICSCARQASELFLYYVHRRNFLETAVVHVAVLAEVWQLAQRLCAATVGFYNALQPYGRRFGEQRTWLAAMAASGGGSAAASDLPERLDDWLGDEWHAECRRALRGDRLAALPDASLTLAQLGGADADAGVFELDGGREADKNAIVDMPMFKVQAPAKVQKPAPPKVQIAKIEETHSVATKPKMLADIGVVVERRPAAQQPKVEHKRPALTLDKLVSTDDVNAYVRSERVRLLGPQATATERLSAERWKELQRKVNHILVTTQGRNTVTAFRKFWSQTVLHRVVR